MIQLLHEFVWGPGMLALFLFVGVLYTIKLCGFPIFGLRKWWKTTVGSLFLHEKRDHNMGISQFQSVCTALAATIGTGNITGVATALLAGGAGSIFWMWISAFLGMATAYAEAELGVKYRRRDRRGNWISGAMGYLEGGMKSRGLAVLYAILCVLASFGMGSMVQANAISETFSYAFSMPPLIIGVFLTLLAARILCGGAGKIARTAEKMVPVSAGIYFLASFLILFLYRKNFPEVFLRIFREAFSISAVSGGIIGIAASQAVRYGVARGVFSNEAGLGSLAALNGGLEDTKPGIQGQWAIFEVFLDTIIGCTLTALVILCITGENLNTFEGNGADLTGFCFLQGLGNIGGYSVSMCTVLFAFSTIIAWYYMGKQAVTYLGETLGIELSRIYFIGYLGCAFLGSITVMETVWEISDILNGFMAIPNLAALIRLVGEVKKPLVWESDNCYTHPSQTHHHIPPKTITIFFPFFLSFLFSIFHF